VKTGQFIQGENLSGLAFRAEKKNYISTRRISSRLTPGKGLSLLIRPFWSFIWRLPDFFHASGMGQELDQPFDEMEELGFFAGDGSTDMAAAVGRWLMMVH